MLQRVPGEVSGCAQPQLIHDRHFVKDGGLDGKAERVGDLLGGSALGNQLEHLALPQSQAFSAGTALPVRYRGGQAFAERLSQYEWPSRTPRIAVTSSETAHDFST